MGLTDLFRREPPVDAEIARAVLAQWQAHFASARADEAEHELAEQRAAASALQRHLDRLPADAPLDAATVRQVLALLGRFRTERDGERSERLDALIDEIAALKRELHLTKLGTAWQSDELARSRELVQRALQGRLTYIPAKADGAPPLLSELIAALLGVAAPPPPPEAHGGQRLATDTPAPTTGSTPQLNRRDGESDLELVRRVLAAALDGAATAARVRRAIDDEALAQRLVHLVQEHRAYRGILERAGVLPT